MPADGVGEPRGRAPSRRTCRPPRCATRTSSTAGAPPRWIRPTTSHLASDGERPRRPRRPTSSTAPGQRRAATPMPHAPTSACERDEHADGDGHRSRRPARTGTARRPPAPTAGAAAGSNVRRSSPGTARAAQLHRRAAEPRRAGLRLLRAPPTARRPARSWARDRPPAAIPELPRNARLPTLARPIRSQPPSELVGGDHRVVGEERAVADGGHLRAAAARWTPRRPCPTVGAEGSQPHRRDEAGVEREQQRAGGVEQPLGGPHLPARCGCAPGTCPRGSRCPSSRTATSVSSGQGDEPHQRWPAGRRGARDGRRRRGRRRRATAAPTTTSAGQRRRHERAAPTWRADADAVDERPTAVPRGGRSSGQRRLALPAARAGEPDQRSPAGTAPTTAEPGSISAPVADARAGEQGAPRADGRVRRPTCTRPTCSSSPSSQ